LRGTLGPDAGAELVTILDEIRSDNARNQAKFDEFRNDVLGRFDRIDRRFEQIDHRFEQIDHRFEQIDHRFEQIERRFEDIDRRFEKGDDRFAAILEKLSDVQSNLMKWSFVFWCGAVAAIAALAGVLK
jgi:chromosome segregation ATPase